MSPDPFARAQRDLEAAQLARDHGFSEQACDIAYYAAFHAASVTLSAAGREAKTHSGTVLIFRELLSQVGMSTEGANTLSQLQTRRERATYSLEPMSESTADDSLVKAAETLTVARRLLLRLSESA